MAYNEAFAQRIRDVLGERPGLVEKKMFGGVGYLLMGNMACGVNKDDLIIRVGRERYEDALSEPHTRHFDMTGRPMKGWIVVTPEGYDSDEELARWVEEGAAFALSLPSK
jgi:hypothetical protein